MYGGYGIGEPAQPAVAARTVRVGRHERANRNDAGGGIAVSIDESHAVGEPGIVHQDPTLGRIAGQEDEVLVGAEADLRDHGPPCIELSAAAPTWLPMEDATAMTPASAAARSMRVGLGNLTDGDLAWTERTSAAHLEGRL